MLPSNSKYARSVIDKVSCTLWSVMRIPIFRFFNAEMMLWMSSTAIGSTPAKGSSSRTNFGFVANALAISVLLFLLRISGYPDFYVHALN